MPLDKIVCFIQNLFLCSDPLKTEYGTRNPPFATSHIHIIQQNIIQQNTQQPVTDESLGQSN